MAGAHDRRWIAHYATCFESAWKLAIQLLFSALFVLGVWLVENYRNSFGQEISANGVDGLIKKLAERNKAAGAAKS